MKNNWITRYNLDSQRESDKYIASLYYSIITMATIGYGDIIPQTLYERIYIIF
jgi:hypothetical protein